MCDPATALMGAGLALSAGMSFMQSQQAAKNQAGMINARNQSNVEAAERQKTRMGETQGVFSDALDKYEGGKTSRRMAEVEARREQALVSNIDPQLTNYTPSGSTGAGPEVVKSEMARKTAQALTAGKQNAKNLAKLGGASDFGFGNMIDLGRSGMRLGELGTLSQGDAALHGIEQSTAITNAYNPPSPWLGVGQAVGQGMQSYGMMGAPGLSGGPPAINHLGSPLGTNGMYGRI